MELGLLGDNSRARVHPWTKGEHSTSINLKVIAKHFLCFFKCADVSPLLGVLPLFVLKLPELKVVVHCKAIPLTSLQGVPCSAERGTPD